MSDLDDQDITDGVTVESKPGQSIFEPAQEYGRKFSLILADGDGKGIDFADFKVEFRIHRGDVQTPNSLDARIFNVAPSTANKIGLKEFTQVAVQAGYENNYGLIFQGGIRQARKGRLNAKDSYIDLTCADGDEAYLYSNMALSLAASPNSAQNSLQAFLASMAAQGITAGYSPTLKGTGMVRGQVFYGLTRDELRQFAVNNDVQWSIQDGKLVLIPNTSYIPGAPILVSAQTGMIGVPEQTENGIDVRVLLNPSIKIGSLIQVQGTVSQFRQSLTVGQSQVAQQGALQTSLFLDVNGLYYVMSVDHEGDTRGQAWYSNLVCLSVDAAIPQSLAPQAAVNSAAESIKRN